jgi:hypothetical protein
MMIKLYITLFLFSTFTLFSQNFELNNQWQSTGPNYKPEIAIGNRNSSGIGPINFIKSSPFEKDLLLAGSVNGGLFYSTTNGEEWLNAGSDYWDYSNCVWADFHPTLKNYWFAVNNIEADGNKPGNFGKKGGVYRTNDKGITWQKIADYQDLKVNFQIKIYGFRFDPISPEKLYLITSDGIYYTLNCLSENVNWLKDSNIKDLVYDMEFIGNTAYICNKTDKVWHLLKKNGLKYDIILPFESYNHDVKHLTIEQHQDNILILVDYNNAGDKLLKYDIENDSIIILNKSQRVIFGQGYTFAVNPHQPNEVYIGIGIGLRRFNLETLQNEQISNGFHPDVEYVAFSRFYPNHIYIGHHGGLSISSDNGKSWSDKSKGLGVCTLIRMAVSEQNSNIVSLGIYHNGSSVLNDWEDKNMFEWKNVNGGDGLTTVIDPKNDSIIYTSNQYNGGGLYASKNRGVNNFNVMLANHLITPGWLMTACLHPEKSNNLFFNYKRKNKNIDLVRTSSPFLPNSVEEISDFESTHQLKKYQVFKIFNSKFHPDILLAYVLSTEKDEKGKSITKHRLYRTMNCLDSAQNVIKSWHELELPRNTWISDIEIDPLNNKKMYISYTGSKTPSNEYPEDRGLIYYTKYSKTNTLKRNYDITMNLNADKLGEYTLCIFSPKRRKKYVFIGTQEGIYMGNKFNLKGGGNWKEVGVGLPHCKVQGIHYNEQTNILTVGLFGRGVWKISLSEK